MQKAKATSKKTPEDLVDLLKLIEEDKFSTKSIKGSSDGENQDQEFATIKSKKLSMLFESINLGEIEHSKVERNILNRFSTVRPSQNSEIFAIKNEMEKRAGRPIFLNLMIIGRKSAGKSSFIKMLLNYVVLL